jgi:hypothetical protein
MNCSDHQILLGVIKWRRVRWAEHAAPHGEMRNAYITVFEITEGRSSLGRHRYR